MSTISGLVSSDTLTFCFDILSIKNKKKRGLFFEDYVHVHYVGRPQTRSHSSKPLALFISRHHV